MEEQAAAQEVKSVKPPKRKAKLFALVRHVAQHANGDKYSGEIIIEADTRNDLKKMLSDANVEQVLRVFRGTELQFQTERKVNFIN